ncbi:heterokaryon incompatibility protein-domain-containing protein [Lasiosphaeria miniovina]|uniref:Heterokaryon incompatibility protein-domain-containing protein n=1 Tax=Lasiosphaeria miniovina TaxID=1954250 RepID=A0AA40E3H6_9PEZI|nr:heterokaryon incompatibility protein-domain-containing protein [Lasiosphaeria miniovina]KAK0726694.1 heterokaryon incompatibility protein-domain-containing protein [Lasiosphaeria miniovina]
MLCARCQNFDIQAFARKAYPYRGFREATVCQSAREGCSFCSLLLQHANIDKEKQPSFMDSITSFFMPRWLHFRAVRYANDLADDGDDGLNISALEIESQYKCLTFQTAADEGTPPSVRRDITGSVMGMGCFTEKNLDRAKAWLQECDLRHTTCHLTLSGTQTVEAAAAVLPSRCIEILDFSTSNPRALGSTSRSTAQPAPWSWRLCETSGMTGKYIALSHRWNDAAEACRTTKANYTSRLQGTRADPTNTDLSPLFVGVCKLACQMDVKHVWIDTLCIIQDAPEDWARESTKMADYYQQAWLTLSATTTALHGGGLIDRVEAEDLPRVSRLPYRNKSGEQEGYFYVQCNQDDVPESYRLNVESSELLHRGWVYQEWTLSRRIMTFSRLGIFLECQSQQPRSVTGDVVHVERQGTRSKLQRAAGSPGAHIHDVILAWKDTVQRFSVMSLTKFAQDRLVAIAGVAREFARAIEASLDVDDGTPEYRDNAVTGLHLGRKYLCGLFPQMIESQLLWECVEPKQVARVDGVPSWSWASVAGSYTDDAGEQKLLGSEVTWAPPPSIHSIRRIETFVCEVTHAATVPVDKGIWAPMFPDARAHAAVPDDEYGNDNRFVVLGVLGVLQPVQIHDIFAPPSDAYTYSDAEMACEATCYTGYSKDHWRRVSTASNPEVVAGWASLESPDFQTTEACRSSRGDIRALYIGKLDKGNWGRYQYAYQVLFLRLVEREKFNSCYERIGLGGLFGPDVERYFETAEETKLHLV